MGDDVTEEEAETPSPRTYSDIFHEVFPHYLMMGMTYELFWDGESSLVRDYRKAYELRQEQKYRERDELAWSNGAYLRQALQSVYLMVNGFVPKGTQTQPYPEKPHWMQEEDRKREEAKQKKAEAQKRKEEDQMRVAMAYFQAAVNKFNKNFEKKRLEEKLKSVPQKQ